MDGRFEAIEDGRAVGWAWNPKAPGERVAVEVWVDGRVAAGGQADRPRGDLAREGIGDGAHGFAIELPAAVLGTAGAELVVTAGPRRAAIKRAERFSAAGGRVRAGTQVRVPLSAPDRHPRAAGR